MSPRQTLHCTMLMTRRKIIFSLNTVRSLLSHMGSSQLPLVVPYGSQRTFVFAVIVTVHSPTSPRLSTMRSLYEIPVASIISRMALVPAVAIGDILSCESSRCRRNTNVFREKEILMWSLFFSVGLICSWLYYNDSHRILVTIIFLTLVLVLLPHAPALVFMLFASLYSCLMSYVLCCLHLHSTLLFVLLNKPCCLSCH